MQTLGWISNCSFILGAYAMANKKPIRFAWFNFCGNIGYSIQSVEYENWSLLGLSLILGTLNLVAVRTWK